jgi:hypothetical protein
MRLTGLGQELYLLFMLWSNECNIAVSVEVAILSARDVTILWPLNFWDPIRGVQMPEARHWGFQAPGLCFPVVCPSRVTL